MTHLVTLENKEPIARTAKRIGCTTETARRHCRSGRLEHMKDASGRLWSSRDAAEAFMHGHTADDVKFERMALEMTGGRR